MYERLITMHSLSPHIVTDSDTCPTGLVAVQVYSEHSVLIRPLINRLPSLIILNSCASSLMGKLLTVHVI